MNLENPQFIQTGALKEAIDNQKLEKENTDNTVEKEESKEKREVIDWAKKAISLWHDQINPDYIFLTESGAIPHGFLLKEAWKNAFPEEGQPIFYRIDPSASHPEVGDYEKEYEKFFKKRITEDSPKIIIFDEGACGTDGVSLEKITIPSQKTISGFIKGMSGTSVDMATNEVSEGLRKINKDDSEIFASRGTPWNFKEGTNQPKNGSSRPTSRLFGVGKTSSHRSRTPDECLVTSKLLEKLVKNGEFTFAGRIVKHPEQKKNAMEWIEQLKKVGAEAGEEVRKEIEKNKK
ncbi:MAG: hypothetical protein WC238_03975 [Parcubacteria group bacterium]|jgi:hypothetical protein